MTLDVPVVDNDLKDLIENIVKGKSKPVFEFEKGSEVGDGYLGVTRAVTVKRDDKVKNLFVKMAPQNDELRKTLMSTEVFDREVYFYSKIYPVLDDLYFSYTKKRLDIAARCYLTSNKPPRECLVFDNLKKLGYRTSNKEVMFDSKHLLKLLEVYGKLHGAGFVLKSKNPQVFAEIVKHTPEIFFVLLNKFRMNDLIKYYMNEIKQRCDIKEDKFIFDNYDKFIGAMTNSFCFDQTEYSTVLHIDCWKNNLMFKYGANGEIEDTKLIDFQMSTANAAVIDLVHLIYSNAASEGNLNDLGRYLDFYYRCLRETIESMDGNVDVLYPRDVFDEQWRRHCFYGLSMALLVNRAVLADQGDLPNYAELIHQKKSTETSWIINIANEDNAKEYTRRIKGLLKHFVERKFI